MVIFQTNRRTEEQHPKKTRDSKKKKSTSSFLPQDYVFWYRPYFPERKFKFNRNGGIWKFEHKYTDRAHVRQRAVQEARADLDRIISEEQNKRNRVLTKARKTPAAKALVIEKKA